MLQSHLRKDIDDIPLRDKLVTIIRISQTDGLVEQAKTDKKKAELARATKPDDIVLAAWTGKFSTDVFMLTPQRVAEMQEYAPPDAGEPAAESKARPWDMVKLAEQTGLQAISINGIRAVVDRQEAEAAESRGVEFAWLRRQGSKVIEDVVSLGRFSPAANEPPAEGDTRAG